MPLSDYITSPTSLRLRNAGFDGVLARRDQYSLVDKTISVLKKNPQSQQPDFGHLILLVFEAVLEVVCVSLPGYIVARQGMFDAESQKFLANLNVTLFTPSLIFTKLASQLTADKLADLAIIPVIFIVQTLVSYACAWVIARCMGFKKRQSNFLIAMGVFGNSNSLPISLVISLSKTLSGLHWDKVPNDNDNEVQARGILYLLIFQQLGQLLRWSWGYNVLLAPADKYTEEEGGIKNISQSERGRGGYRDDPEEEQQRLLSPHTGSDDSSDDRTQVADSPTTAKSTGLRTPGTSQNASTINSRSSSRDRSTDLMPTPANGMIAPHHRADLGTRLKKYDEDIGGFKGQINHVLNEVQETMLRIRHFIAARSSAAFGYLPRPVQKVFRKIYNAIAAFLGGLYEFMNPPLWAMLIAIVVASVPQLQHLFFDNGTFVRNSVTRAVEQSAGVAVPLILVVLGGNLARNTIPKGEGIDITDPKEERRLLIASLVSRMLLPTIIMAPVLAVIAKYVPVSIVDDKIFVIVCFLLTGAPTALQLAQICQGKCPNFLRVAFTNQLCSQPGLYVCYELHSIPELRYLDSTLDFDTGSAGTPDSTMGNLLGLW